MFARLLLITLCLMISPKADASLQEEWRVVWSKGEEGEFPIQSLELFYHDKSVFKQSEFMLELVSFGTATLFDCRRDFVVLQGFTGGAHCCSWVKIISLKDPGKEITSLEIQGAPPLWQDVDEDGNLELVTSDYTFDYWHAPHYASALPEVILRFDGKELVPDSKLMKDNDVTLADLQKYIDEIKIDSKELAESNDTPFALDNDSQATMTIVVLDLLYTGNHKLARQFLDLVWPKGNPDKEKYRAELNKKLNESPYWPQLRKQGWKAI